MIEWTGIEGGWGLASVWFAGVDEHGTGTERNGLPPGRCFGF